MQLKGNKHSSTQILHLLSFFLNKVILSQRLKEFFGITFCNTWYQPSKCKQLYFKCKQIQNILFIPGWGRVCVCLVWFGCCKIYILFNLLASVSSECINSTQVCTLNLVILRSDVHSSVLKFFKNWTVFQQESEFFFIQILICFWSRCKDVKVSKCKIEKRKSLFCILQILCDFVLTGNHIKT